MSFGSLMINAVDSISKDQGFFVLIGITVSSKGKHFTFTMPLSTQECEWGGGDILLS